MLTLLDSQGAGAPETDHFADLAQQLRDTERAVANRMRAENQIHDEVLRKLERELDLMDARFSHHEDR